MRYLLYLLPLLVACSTPRATTEATTAPGVETTAPATAPASFAGTWSVTVSNTPVGTVTGDMMLTEGPDGLTGTFSAGSGEAELSSVTTTDEGLQVVFYSSEYQMDVDIRLNGSPDDDTLEGSTLSSYKTTATRK